MPKTALVISGGGCKGAFAVGVLKQMKRDFPDIRFDIVVGTSTGALIAPFAALGDIDILETLYTTVTTDKIITKGNVVNRLLGDDSLFDAKPLANLIKQFLTDDRCQQLFQSPVEVFIATTCLQTGEAVNFATLTPPIVSNNIVRKVANADQLRRAVMASACQPVFMPPIEVDVNAQPRQQFVDGGVREYAGIDLAIEAGADEIYAILLTPAQADAENKVYSDTFSILQRTIDTFSTEVNENDLHVPMLFNRGLRYIAAVRQKLQDAGVSAAIINQCFNIELTNPFAGKQPKKIFVIRPVDALGGGPGGLDFDPTAMKGMLALGQMRLTNYMATRPPNGDDLA